MLTLASAADLLTYLGEDSGDGGLLTIAGRMGAAVESALNADCLRTERPFLIAPTPPATMEDRTEVHDGTGGRSLYLDYPVTGLVSLVLGYDASDPDVTLDVDDPTEVQFRVGHRRIRRLDGEFGCQGQSGYVHVTYTPQADAPDDAVQVLMDEVSRLWQQRGSQDATVERYGGAHVELAVERSAAWKAFVERHREVGL